MILRIMDLVAVLEALMAPEDVSPERMLMVLTKLRGTGRLITLHTSPTAFGKVAQALDISRKELEHGFHQAPNDGRERLKTELLRREHQGCVHLRARLAGGVHAAALLDAFVTASWYGWPGLRLQVSEEKPGFCCCGTEIAPPGRAELRPMSAIDI